MPSVSLSAAVADDETTTPAIVGVVAEELCAAWADPDPLYEVIDPDGLDSLFDTDRSDADRTPGRSEFTFTASTVTVPGDGSLTVSEALSGTD